MADASKSLRLGVLTGGGDCPGLNAVIRAVAKSAMNLGEATVYGIQDAYVGLVEGRAVRLQNQDVSGILTQGGTILGSNNRDNPFETRVMRDGQTVIEDRSDRGVAFYRELGLDALVVIGGDGTMRCAAAFAEKGLMIVGVPKTIDNDLRGTDRTFGFDSAVQTVTEALDKVHTTAMSHHRVMIVEVMGRTAGWIALHGGVAGGGDVILMPEIPFDYQRVCDAVQYRSRRGKKFSIVVVAEGAQTIEGDTVYQQTRDAERQRLGGIGHMVAREIVERTGLDTRVVVLGHLQRGGTPTALDRVLSTRFGHHAFDLVAERRYNRMVCLRGDDIADVALADVAGPPRTVPVDHPLIHAAVAVGTEFGAEV